MIKAKITTKIPEKPRIKRLFTADGKKPIEIET
jgi:hypothetical protein